jgi:AcrR family transcriptional regulator
VGRTPDKAKRKALRAAIARHILSHGVADLSLRSLAEALGTSARMLLHYFGTRDVLLREALEGVRDQEDSRIQAWFENQPEDKRTLRDFLAWYWPQLIDPKHLPFLRAGLEIYALGIKDPEHFGSVLENPLAYWLRLVKKPLASKPTREEESLATLALAITRGLIIDFVATEDAARIKRTMDKFIRLLDSQSAQT